MKSAGQDVVCYKYSIIEVDGMKSAGQDVVCYKYRKGSMYSRMLQKIEWTVNLQGITRKSMQER